MSIKEKIQHLVKQTKNKDLLQWVYETLAENSSGKDFMSNLSEEQLKNYKESSSQAEKGETISHFEAMKRIRRWKNLKK